MVRCFLCSYNFIDINTYTNHLKFVHKCSNMSNFKCTDCLQSFQSLYSFKRHIRKHMENENNTEIKFTPLKISTNECNINAEEGKYSITNLPEMHSSKLTSNMESLETSPEINFKNSLLSFVLKLFGSMSLSRKVATEIITFVHKLVIIPFAENIKQVLNNHAIDKEIIEALLKEMYEFVNIFEQIQSEYKLKLFLKESDLFSDPCEFLINSSDTTVSLSNVHKGILLPLKENLRRFLELPNVLKSMYKNLEDINNSDKIKNICSGSVWKKKMENFQNKNVLPYLLYQDDFEINNALGSKAGIQKISAFYITLPLINAEDISKLNNIFVACLTKTVSLEFGLQYTFGNLCSVLKNLEEKGIDIEIDRRKQTIYLILAAITGDNLGLNTVMGYSRSFSANFFCRICKVHKDVAKTQTVENKSLLRNEKNYWQDVLLNDVSQTGIRESSVFCNIPSFEITSNVTVDIMHDLFEGICHNELCYFLKYFIFEKKYFTLDTLNVRKTNFQYHNSDSANKSVNITVQNLNNFKLKMSASEMQCFVHHLSLIIGDLVPRNDPVWDLLNLLTKLIRMSLLPSYDQNKLKEFENIINDHHKTYMHIFQTNLIPKHHFILHYPNVIRQLGPLKRLWVMRQEAKHKQAKTYMNVITSRKNVLLSAAVKWQFCFSNHIYSQRNNKLKISDNYSGKYVDLSSELSQFSVLDVCPTELSHVFSISYCFLYNMKYQINDIITIAVQNSLDQIELHLISLIVIIHNEIYFVTQNVPMERYDEHFDGYVIQSRNENISKTIIKASKITYLPTNIVTLNNMLKIVKLKPEII